MQPIPVVPGHFSDSHLVENKPVPCQEEFDARTNVLTRNCENWLLISIAQRAGAAEVVCPVELNAGRVPVGGADFELLRVRTYCLSGVLFRQLLRSKPIRGDQCNTWGSTARVDLWVGYAVGCEFGSNRGGERWPGGLNFKTAG